MKILSRSMVLYFMMLFYLMFSISIVKVYGFDNLIMKVNMNKKFYDGDRIPFTVILTNISNHAIEVIEPSTCSGTIPMPHVELLYADESDLKYDRLILSSRIPLSKMRVTLEPRQSISYENVLTDSWYPAGFNPGKYAIRIRYSDGKTELSWEGELSIEIPDNFRSLYPNFSRLVNSFQSGEMSENKKVTFSEIKDFIDRHPNFPNIAYLFYQSTVFLPVEQAEILINKASPSVQTTKFYDVAQKELANRRMDRVRDDKRERHSAMIRQKLRDPQLKIESQAYLHCKSISDYQRFVTTYPRSIFAPEALHELIALCVESQRDYREFKEKLISDYPDSFWGKKIIGERRAESKAVDDSGK